MGQRQVHAVQLLRPISRAIAVDAIRTIIASSSLSDLTSKKVRKSLESTLDVSLKPHKEYIDELLMSLINADKTDPAPAAAAEAAADAPREPSAAEIAAAEETARLRKVVKKCGLEPKTRFIKKAGVPPEEYNARLAEGLVI